MFESITHHEAMPEQVQSARAPQHIAGPWSIELPVNLCRQPGLSANHSRKNVYRNNASVQAVREAVTYLLRSLINRRAMPDRFDKIRVDLTWYVSDRRKRDEDNLSPLLKAVCDAIGSDRGTGVRLVADDDPAHMQKRPHIIHRPGAPAGFTVTITNLGGLP